MKANVKDIAVYLSKFLLILKHHVVFIFIVSIFTIIGFLVFQINSLSSIEPSDEKISEELDTIKRPKIDQNVVKKIEQLEDQNVGIQSLFKAARDNPFQDQ